MKKIIFTILVAISISTLASVPTEEGLLRNLNNPVIPGEQVTIKATVRKVNEPGKPEVTRIDYYKFVFLLNNEISLFQINYSGSQMLNSQIQDVKLITDLVGAIKKDKSAERSMFYALMTMLSGNRSDGVEAFLLKSGVAMTKNKKLLNEEKLKLLKSYRNYLTTVKGKGEASSPLNPKDPIEKGKVIDLFKSNTYERSQNVSLIKEGVEFFWKADWKTVRAYFTNEERRFKSMEYQQGEIISRIDAADYNMFNNNNEFPRNITVKDSQGEQYKIQILSEEVKKSADKKLAERFAEAQKAIVKPIDQAELFDFIF